MSATNANPTNSGQSAPERDPGLRLVCSELWGGNRPIHAPVELPGLRGMLFSQPCGGGRGGDVHYLSVCGSGLLSRACLADVVGHGEAVATVAGEMHALMRRSMNTPDQRRVLRNLNRRLTSIGLDAMTTAAAVTYYPPSRKLSISYAGHPPGWYYSKASKRWSRLDVAEQGSPGRLFDGPLAVDPDADYSRTHLQLALGDRVFLLTDGVLEAPGPGGTQFGAERVEAALQAAHDADMERIGRTLLDTLTCFSGDEKLSHDDVTFLILEAVPGPAGPTLWTVLKNRLLRPRGNSEESH